MFHHGVWINLSAHSNSPFGQLFAATGEEKTIMEFPEGYGYRYKASDGWLLNHMIHNLTSQDMKLDIQYTIDFIPDTAPEAANMKPVEPIWMDVERGSIYPVFNVYKGSGENGKFTYPRDDPNAYPAGVHKNLYTLPQDGVLISTAGHVHTGGLYTDLSWPTRRQVRRAEVQHEAQRRAKTLLLGERAPGQGRPRPPVPLPREVLRTGRAGLLGHGDEGDPAGLDGAGEEGRYPRHPGDLRDEDRLLV